MTTANHFESIPGDPLSVKIHTLRNGMKLYMSPYPREPRIYTHIAVRAGSKLDPPDTTGLAHYMEHMLFKGTSRIGALDWEREARYLEQISALFERYRQTRSPEKRSEIYREIDRLSVEAAALVAPNEYDRLAGAIGARHTNAYTWVDQTVYVNEIPANELERWMKLEAERFRMLALRLFHTELETVYEEFNISQDQDMRKANDAIRQALFPQHPYGTQSTIGSAEHLKNPSQAKIQEFFRTYYVPNNMAILLSGDFDPDAAVRLAEQYFGAYRPVPIPPFECPGQPAIDGPLRREVFGQEAAYIDIGWRFGGARTDHPLMLAIIKELFYNQQAGLLDLHLNQQQRVLNSHAWVWAYEDYSAFGLYGKPREGQRLEEVEALLLGEVEKLRQGDFEDWLLEAVIRDLRLADTRGSESIRYRVDLMAHAFILGIDWARIVNRFSFWNALRKEDITAFARKHLNSNCVIVYKQQGDDPAVIKMEKPPISPIALRRDATSEFAQAFLEQIPGRLQPEFPDFGKLIGKTELQPGLWFDYVHNEDNELFRLDYVFPMGKVHDRLLPLALIYLQYLGTSRYSAAALQQEFFRLGLSFDISGGTEYSYLTISGLDGSLEEGLRLVEHLLAEMQEDAPALENMVSDILAKRANARKDRRHILRSAMGSYARYGGDSPSPTAWRSRAPAAGSRPTNLLAAPPPLLPTPPLLLRPPRRFGGGTAHPPPPPRPGTAGAAAAAAPVPPAAYGKKRSPLPGLPHRPGRRDDGLPRHAAVQPGGTPDAGVLQRVLRLRHVVRRLPGDPGGQGPGLFYLRLLRLSRPPAQSALPGGLRRHPARQAAGRHPGPLVHHRIHAARCRQGGARPPVAPAAPGKRTHHPLPRILGSPCSGTPGIRTRPAPRPLPAPAGQHGRPPARIPAAVRPGPGLQVPRAGQPEARRPGFSGKYRAGEGVGDGGGVWGVGCLLDFGRS
ncbi:MAG: insulinase family protein [Lewinellaceae bacterium]|nr:insulinase family protein [Lewinellaceae bacterium]